MSIYAPYLSSYLDLSKIRQGVNLIFAYLTTAIFLTGAILFLKDGFPPETLKIVLAYIFISGVASGIEPGTAKILLIKAKQSSGLFYFSFKWLLIASILKSVLATPFIALMWLSLQAGGLDAFEIFFYSLVSLIVGFLTTELRVVFDSNERFATAIWLKQGSLSVGFMVIALALWIGISIEFAIALSLSMRFIWALIFHIVNSIYFQASLFKLRDFRREFFDFGWVDLGLVSILAAIGGSIDRIVALRYLNLNDASEYFIIYEILSKFWIIAYLFSPIVFVKSARGVEALNLIKVIVLGTIFLGILYVSMIFSVLNFWPYLVHKISNGVSSVFGITCFSISMVITSISIIISAYLQGIGKARVALIISFIGMCITGVVFYAFTLYAGILGLYFSWLVKGLIELAMFSAFVYYLRRI